MRKKVKTAFDPKIFLAKVGEGKTVSSYRKDQIVFSQGDPADAVFYIQQGKVKLTVISQQGKEAVVAIVGPGHFFGEGCLNGHPLRIATTRAVDDDCVITRLEKATMIATIHKEPEFSELFMSYLLTRNSRIEEDLIDQLFNSSEKRLARLLLLLANFGKEGTPEPIVGKYSQEMLAEMIGTTRSRVSFFMNKFRKLGFIEYNGKLEVHSSLLNMVLHEKPEIKERDEAGRRRGSGASTAISVGGGLTLRSTSSPPLPTTISVWSDQRRCNSSTTIIGRSIPGRRPRKIRRSSSR
jgi:CRP/FNR family cyclic AMP-dependent transcriptional regulator